MLPFADVPFNRALAFELVESAAGTAVIREALQPWFAQENGVVHGGIISSVADTAAVYALRSSGDAAMTGVEFKINFLRAARLDGGDLVARAKTVRRGRTIGVVDVDVFQGEEHIATGLFTYVFLR